MESVSCGSFPENFVEYINAEKERLSNLLFIAHSELGQVIP